MSDVLSFINTPEGNAFIFEARVSEIDVEIARLRLEGLDNWKIVVSLVSRGFVPRYSLTTGDVSRVLTWWAQAIPGEQRRLRRCAVRASCKLHGWGTPVDHTYLETRVLNALRGLGVEFLQELIFANPHDLLRFPNFGKRSLEILEIVLGEHGLRLGEALPPEART